MGTGDRPAREPLSADLAPGMLRLICGHCERETDHVRVCPDCERPGCGHCLPADRHAPCAECVERRRFADDSRQSRDHYMTEEIDRMGLV